jgi:hypothetical protein
MPRPYPPEFRARAVGRILQRHAVPRLSDCDPLTGVPIRAARTTANRYERARPGELVHLDVKKLGRIPEGGGWRAHGRSEGVRGRGIGYDYVHVCRARTSRQASTGRCTRRQQHAGSL